MIEQCKEPHIRDWPGCYEDCDLGDTNECPHHKKIEEAILENTHKVSAQLHQRHESKMVEAMALIAKLEARLAEAAKEREWILDKLPEYGIRNEVIIALTESLKGQGGQIVTDEKLYRKALANEREKVVEWINQNALPCQSNTPGNTDAYLGFHLQSWHKFKQSLKGDKESK